MATELSIRVSGDAQLREELRKLPASLFEAAKTEITRATLDTQTGVLSRLRGGPLYTRTGNLARSIRTEVKGNTLDTLQASVYSSAGTAAIPVVYAPIHEFGGTVYAKQRYRKVPGGPYLNIPLPANKTAAGVTRQTAKQVFSSGGFIRRSRLGNYLIFGKSSGVTQPLFALKRSVRIPARLGMLDTATVETKNLIDRLQKFRVF